MQFSLQCLAIVAIGLRLFSLSTAMVQDSIQWKMDLVRRMEKDNKQAPDLLPDELQTINEWQQHAQTGKRFDMLGKEYTSRAVVAAAMKSKLGDTVAASELGVAETMYNSRDNSFNAANDRLYRAHLMAKGAPYRPLDPSVLDSGVAQRRPHLIKAGRIQQELRKSKNEAQGRAKHLAHAIGQQAEARKLEASGQTEAAAKHAAVAQQAIQKATQQKHGPSLIKKPRR